MKLEPPKADSGTCQIYLARHAAPDMSIQDIPYDEVPGPPLIAAGFFEAQQLAEFLAPLGIARLYTSPLLRAQQTAATFAELAGLATIVDPAIAEWRKSEKASEVVTRVMPSLERFQQESRSLGPIALVSHGGTIGVMLRKLGMPREEVDAHVHRVGGSSPVPTAGVWCARRASAHAAWRFEMVFQPEP